MEARECPRASYFIVRHKEMTTQVIILWTCAYLIELGWDTP
jgi:hypothetical protein